MLKQLFVILFLCLPSWLLAQASWSTFIAFKLLNEKKEVVDGVEFKQAYTLVDVHGREVPVAELDHFIQYNEKSNYLLLNITTIGPRFSFAIRHKQKKMVIYLPFRHNNWYYALDLPFREGLYLLDFDVKGREKIYLNSNLPYYRISTINWKQQAKRFRKSAYAQNQTYTYP